MADENLFYRLRSLDRLLGDKWQENDGKSGELAKQEIYFASPSELNDPMEGFSNIVFKGDKIVWHNFFKHYVLCLERMYNTYNSLGSKEKLVDLSSLPIYETYNIFLTAKNKKMFDGVYMDFKAEYGEVIDKIAERTTTITLYELHSYLRVIHTFIFDIIEKHYIPNIPFHIKNDTEALNKTNKNNIIQAINATEQLKNKSLKLNNDKQNTNTVAILHEILKTIIDSMNLNPLLQHLTKNQRFMQYSFPDTYLQNLDKLMYPEYRVACFLKEAYNSSVWGHYADGHRGVCLIFKSHNKYLNLFGINPFSEEKQNHTLEFKAIHYKSFDKIDFFENVCARLTGRELSYWYQNENGEKSPIMSKIFANEDKWRKKYWKKAEKRLLTKTKDWKYEKEYRLTINSFLKDKIEGQERIFKYNFNDLDGIIFGINTPQDAKEKIIDIVRQKCKNNNRQEFNLYQAYYCDKNKNIQYVPLPKFVLGFKAQSNNQNATNKAD